MNNQPDYLTKKYREECNCEEVQGNREPQVGDKVYSKSQCKVIGFFCYFNMNPKEITYYADEQHITGLCTEKLDRVLILPSETQARVMLEKEVEKHAGYLIKVYPKKDMAIIEIWLRSQEMIDQTIATSAPLAYIRAYKKLKGGK